MPSVNYIEYRVSDGKIIRNGLCNAARIPEADPGNMILQMKAGSRYQKVVCDGYDEKGLPVRPRLVDIPYERRRPVAVTPDQTPVQATQADWQALVRRVEALESEWTAFRTAAARTAPEAVE